VPVDAFNRGTFVIAGQPTVSLNATTAQSRVQFNVRLFDIAPGGDAQLVTRGTYTLDTGLPSVLPVTHPVRISTQGNLWRAVSGHVLRLEITNADFPYMAPSQLFSMTEISGVRLTMPVR
jgi:predicted acyl esterase